MESRQPETASLSALAPTQVPSVPSIIPDVPDSIPPSEVICTVDGRSSICHGKLVFPDSTISVKILVDTGASRSYLDKSFAERHSLPLLPHSSPIPLTLFDGQSSSSGPIISFAQCDLVLGDFSLLVDLDVTNLSGVDVVVGALWLHKHRLVLDLHNSRILGGAQSQSWAERSVRFDDTVKECMVSSPSGEDSLSESDDSTLVAPTRKRLKRKRPKKSRAKSRSRVSGRSLCSSGGDYSSPSRAKLCAVIDKHEEIDYLDDVPGLASFDVPEGFTPEEYKEVLQAVPKQYHEFLDVFQPGKALYGLAPHRETDLKIRLVEGARLKVAPLYNLSPGQSETLRNTLDRELEAGRIRPSNSAYGSPVFFVKKKDGSWRMVVDYRELNHVTIPDVYPLPLISQIMGDLAGSTVFSLFDIYSAYQQQRMSDDSVSLTAFRTQYGMFESLVVRDGLKNAPPGFQTFLNQQFTNLLGHGVIVYIDDIIVHAQTLERLRKLTWIVMERLWVASLYLKAKKCLFEVSEVKFLGFIVSKNGIAADPGYVQGVMTFPRPTSQTSVRRFLGLAGYYWRFVPKFATIAQPLNRPTGAVPFQWGKEEEKAFVELRERMSRHPVLAHFDPSLKTIIQTDASAYGWGFVISQVDDKGEEHPIAIESGAFKNAELNYTVTEKEFLAIVNAFRRRRHLLLQVESTVLTDHHNLKYWMAPKQLNPRQARWVDALAEFSFKIVYWKGKNAIYPDALSRREDYSDGKQELAEVNFVQALPNYSDEVVTSELSHFL